MEIITSSGTLKTLLPDVGVMGSRGMRTARMCAKVTSAAANSRTAGQSTWLTFDTVVVDNYNCFRPAVSAARVYAPMTGWYLASLYLKSSTATAHDATLQIHNTYLASHLAYKKWILPAGSANYPNAIALNGVCYLPKDAYFYTNWGASQAITALTGEANIGFAIWKLS